MSAMEEETGAELVIVEPERYTPARIVGGIPHLEQYLVLAERISRTAMVPSALRNKPDEVLAVVMYGAELGIGPMQALQQINFIAGKPSAAAELLRALVMEAGHKFILEADTKVATATVKRKDWDKWRTTTFTIEDAQRANLVRGDGWTKYPDQMLAARVTSKACRMFFPDVISGMSYTPEEVEAFSPPPASTSSTRRAATPATTVREAPVIDAKVVETGEEWTGEQRDQLQTGLDLLEPAEKKQFAAWWKANGIPPASHGLTSAQAVAALAALRALLDAGDAQTQPPLDGPTGASQGSVAADAIEAPKATAPQVGKIRAMLGNTGVDKADVHTVVGDIIGHQIESLKDLTKDEAHKVIDQLTADAE